MKRSLNLIFMFVCVQPMYSYGRGCAVNKDCDREPLVDQWCDSCGYYFDRGGRRMFETSYDTYQRGTFNLRRGHLWKDRTHRSRLCKRVHKSRCSGCTVTERAGTRYTEKNLAHEHYAAREGLTRWPTTPGPQDWQRGTKGFPYVETPIWLRDTTDASGYATPTSWQGFQ